MGRILRIPAVEVFTVGKTNEKEYMLSDAASLIDINDITIMEIYDEHTGSTINRYIVSVARDPYYLCKGCAFGIDKKDRIAGVCTNSKKCRDSNRIFLAADNVLEEL